MDWLNYHHLLYFWTVAREGGLRQAAEKLSISQPSISAQVRLLEDTIGEKLFERRGRKLVLTEAGQFAAGYADEIFSLGAEFMAAVRRQEPARMRAARFTLGVEDSFPKSLAFEILQPIFESEPPLRLVSREGKADELLAQLAVHRLDAVLADQPATGTAKFKVFSHLLGRSVATVCAAPPLARRLRRGFPKSLNNAPALLPTANATLRRALDEWFHTVGVQPHLVAEFEDAAMMKIAAAGGRGFIAVPFVTMKECIDCFGLQEIGRIKSCTDTFYLITGERRVTHPAVLMLANHARRISFT